MIKRYASNLLLEKLKRFPIVTILGARQCGKTTFIKQLLPTWTYLDMEKPSDLAPFSQDPESRIRQLKSKIIVDEAQRLPEIFPLLRSVVDEEKRNGRFVLLGSASPTLIQHISESLAGRTAFLDMTPFRWNEVSEKRDDFSFDALWLRGGFPQPFLEKKSDPRADWYEAYTRTFIERDLAALGIDIAAPQMRKLWTMLAHLNGGIWNASTLAASLGVSYHTVNRYTDILEQTFLVRKLQPYFVNLGKRIIKSPKIYFRDTGLLHYFLGIHDKTALNTHPARGLSWESFLLEQIVTGFQMITPRAQPTYYRTSGGIEIDLLIERGTHMVPFEIKLHSAPTRKDVPGLVKGMEDLKLKKGYVLYPGREDYSLGSGITVLSAEKILKNIKNLAAL